MCATSSETVTPGFVEHVTGQDEQWVVGCVSRVTQLHTPLPRQGYDMLNVRGSKRLRVSKNERICIYKSSILGEIIMMKFLSDGEDLRDSSRKLPQ